MSDGKNETEIYVRSAGATARVARAARERKVVETVKKVGELIAAGGPLGKGLEAALAAIERAASEGSNSCEIFVEQTFGTTTRGYEVYAECAALLRDLGYGTSASGSSNPANERMFIEWSKAE